MLIVIIHFLFVVTTEHAHIHFLFVVSTEHAHIHFLFVSNFLLVGSAC
jgi:hypothetical protein